MLPDAPMQTDNCVSSCGQSLAFLTLVLLILQLKRNPWVWFPRRTSTPRFAAIPSWKVTFLIDRTRGDMSQLLVVTVKDCSKKTRMMTEAQRKTAWLRWRVISYNSVWRQNSPLTGSSLASPSLQCNLKVNVG